MILHLVAILMILGLAYLQMMQGFFSSVIMAVCTIFSAAAAVALFPWFAATTGLYSLQPAIADAVSFGLLFVGPLIGLRFLTDTFIRGDIYFDVIVDRAGGAIFGLFSGTVMIGVLLVVIQLAPFGRVVWGDFRPYTDSLQRDKRIVPLLPDEFVVGFGEMISSGSMSAGEKLTDRHDDLLLEAFCARNTAGGNSQTGVETGAIHSIRLYPGVNMEDREFNTDKTVATQLVVMRVVVNVSAADDATPHWWRLPATHFRLLCRVSRGREKTYESFYPVGYVYYDVDAAAVRLVPAPHDADNQIEPAKLIVERPKEAGVYGEPVGKEKIPQDEINLVVDWIYLLPKNAAPEAMFFRRVDAVKTPGISGKYDPNKIAFHGKMLKSPKPEEKKSKHRRRKKKKKKKKK